MISDPVPLRLQILRHATLGHQVFIDPGILHGMFSFLYVFKDRIQHGRCRCLVKMRHPFVREVWRFSGLPHGNGQIHDADVLHRNSRTILQHPQQ